MGAKGSGRLPRPNHLKALDGARESRINRDEPLPALPASETPPDELTLDAKRIWKLLAPGLISRRVLTADDVELFAAFCRSMAMYRHYAMAVDGNGVRVQGSHGTAILSPEFRAMNTALDQAVRLSARFGLTPSDRAGLRIDAPADGASASRLLS